MASARKTIPGSARTPLAAPPVGTPDPQERAEVSVYLKRPPAQARTSRADLRESREDADAARLRAGRRSRPGAWA